MAYAHHLNIDQFRGKPGPVSGYSPIGEAWKSDRTTTKPRDYVLAVFPDVKGYKIPPNAKAYSFKELLGDAIAQLQEESLVAVKAIDGRTKHDIKTTEKIQPFILEDPENVSEAFDTFAPLDDGPRDDLTPRFAASFNPQIVSTPGPVVLETVQINYNSLPALVSLWNSTANNLQHFLGVCVAGSCIPTGRDLSLESLCFRHLAFEFSAERIREWSLTTEAVPGIAHGIVDWAKSKEQISDDEFSLLIKRFMTCLLCGCALRTAKELLLFTDFRVVGSPFGKLLALVNKQGLAIAEDGESVLLNRGLLDFEEFHVAVRHQRWDRYRIVGRTWIPKTSALAPPA
jgi:hypothetical protein